MTGPERRRHDATPIEAVELQAGNDTVWRYPDMCDHWNVSRATVERWVRRYETHGEGIPVHRDPSGRPYWLPDEATGRVVAAQTAATPTHPIGDDRTQRLRRAAQRGHRVA